MMDSACPVAIRLESLRIVALYPGTLKRIANSRIMGYLVFLQVKQLHANRHQS